MTSSPVAGSSGSATTSAGRRSSTRGCCSPPSPAALGWYSRQTQISARRTTPTATPTSSSGASGLGIAQCPTESTVETFTTSRSCPPRWTSRRCGPRVRRAQGCYAFNEVLGHALLLLAAASAVVEAWAPGSSPPAGAWDLRWAATPPQLQERAALAAWHRTWDLGSRHHRSSTARRRRTQRPSCRT